MPSFWHSRSVGIEPAVSTYRMSMKPLKRHDTMIARLGLGGLSFVLALQAALALVRGEPGYLNYFRQPVSAPVALVLAIGGLLLVIFFWPEGGRSKVKMGRRRSAASVVRRTDEGLPGRNDPCHCGSGLKYKKCCLRADEKAQRRARLARQSAQLNRSRGVTSGAQMADRGFRGR